MGILTDLSLRLSANTAGLKSDLGDATKELKNFSKGVSEQVQKTVDSFKHLDAASSSVKELRTAFKSLNNISFAGKSVEEIHLINSEIGRLKDEMGDLKALQKGLGTEFGDLAAKGLQGLAGLAEVGMALASTMGMSDKTAAKWQANMTMMIGAVQGLGEFQSMLGDKTLQSIAIRVKETAATWAQTAATWAQNAAQWAAAASGAALMATIGLVIVAVAAVAAGIYYLVRAFSKSDSTVNASIKKIKEYDDAHKQLTQTITDQRNILMSLQRENLVATGKMTQEEYDKWKLNQARILDIQKAYEQAKVASAAIFQNTLNALEKAGDADRAAIISASEKEKIKVANDLQNVLLGINANYQEGLIKIHNENKPKVAKAASASGKASGDAWVEAYFKSLELAQYDVPQFIKGVNTSDSDMTPMKGKSNILPKQDKDFADSLKKRHALSMKYQAAEASEAAQTAAKMKEIEDAKNESKLQALSNTFGLAKGMFAENTIAYKAMAIAQAGIDTYMAANVALASAPPPFNFILMGATIAAGLVNVAKIAGFANGGIVAGSSYTGDKVPVQVNSGEMILNGSQQAKLFAMATGNSMMGNNRGGQVQFEIKGDKLVGVLNNYGRKINNTR